MTPAEEVALIVGMALVTFGVRYPILALAGRAKLPGGVAQALRYVPVAVLSALVAPAVLMPDGALDISLRSAHLIGGVATIIIAWRTRNLLLTIGAGMLIFLGWRLLAGT